MLAEVLADFCFEVDFFMQCQPVLPGREAAALWARVIASLNFASSQCKEAAFSLTYEEFEVTLEDIDPAF